MEKQALSKELVQHLATLCHIGCSEEKQNQLLADFANIVSYVEMLAEVDTEETKECVCVTTGMEATPLREDVPEEDISREQFLAGAPDVIAGLVRVPVVL